MGPLHANSRRGLVAAGGSGAAHRGAARAARGGEAPRSAAAGEMARGDGLSGTRACAFVGYTRFPN